MIPNTHGVDRRLLGLVVLSSVFGLGHHIDHVIRGNHVGWPISPEINAFTYSLAIYPLIIAGIYLTLTDRVGARYWAAVALLGLGMLAGIHLGPWAIEPPHDIVDPYRPGVFGYVAFAWLLGLLGTLAVTAAYSIRQWRRGRAA